MMTLELELRVRTVHPDELDATAAVMLRPGHDATFGLLVRNSTGRPQHLEVRSLPEWARAKVTGAQTAPGSAQALEVTISAAAIPGALVRSPTGPIQAGPALGKTAFAMLGGRLCASGLVIVSSDDEALNVGIWVFRGPSRRETIATGVLAGLIPWPFGFGAAVLCLWALTRRRPADDPSMHATFERGRREVERSAAWTLLASTLGTAAAVILALVAFAFA